MTAWDDSALIPKGGPAWKHEHIMKLGSQVQECSAPHLQTLGFSCDVCWANIQSQTVRHARRTWSSWSEATGAAEQPAGESGSQWVFPQQAQPDRDTPSGSQVVWWSESSVNESQWLQRKLHVLRDASDRKRPRHNDSTSIGKVDVQWYDVYSTHVYNSSYNRLLINYKIIYI